MDEQQINRYWKRIVNTMNDGLMLVGPEGSILMVNRAFEKLTGYGGDEVIGRPCTLLECDACEKMLQNEGRGWCTLLHEGQKDLKRCRCMIARKDGTWLPALKNASVLRDGEGRPLGVVETLTDISELDRLEEEVERLSRWLDDEGGFCGIIGESPAMVKAVEVIEKAAQSDVPVIIYGESGTGKELAAHAIHRLGPRRERPFVQFNCAALNQSLCESELFGHIKGAFTGAHRHRLGRFEAANGGDIFLDEIGDIPMPIQVKLLRVLEAKQFERVGDNMPISVNVRIISATNQNLNELVSAGRFREDLFFRINVIPVVLPPLRERTSDIPLLVSAFIRRLRKKTGKPITGLSRDVLEAFMSYPWPGNVRELKSALEYAFIIGEEGRIQPEHLPPQILKPARQGGGTESWSFGGRTLPTTPLPQRDEPRQRRELVEALRRTGGNQSQAARLLGINRVTVWNRMKKYGIDLQRVLRIPE